MRRCHACGKELDEAERVLHADECPHCGSDLHCCRNCRHFDPAVNNQCREVVAEWVAEAEKERANFCECFVFADSIGPTGERIGRPPMTRRERGGKKLFRS